MLCGIKQDHELDPCRASRIEASRRSSQKGRRGLLVTVVSFASAVQVAGTSKAKQVPVRVGFMTFRFLGFRSARPRVLVGAGPAVSGFPWGVP